MRRIRDVIRWCGAGAECCKHLRGARHAAGKWVRKANPRYIEDARDVVLGLGDKDKLVDATLDWIRSETVLAYHGTRLTVAELESVRARGLVPLQALARREAPRAGWSSRSTPWVAILEEMAFHVDGDLNRKGRLDAPKVLRAAGYEKLLEPLPA
jgi:hypothetical protein